MSSRLRFRFKEAIYFSRYVRGLWVSILRLFFAKELAALNAYIAAERGSHLNKRVIVLSLGSSEFEHIIEHLKEIYFRLKNHPSFIIVPITSANLFYKARSRKSLLKYEKKFGLIYGKNLFSYIWLSKIAPSIYIELTPSSYADFCRSSVRIMYAHGLANVGFGKDFRHVRYVSKYDYLFLTGPLQKKALLEAQKTYGGKLPEMVEIGFFRGDRLLAEKENCNKPSLLNAMNLDSKYTLLFAPTWGDFSATHEWIDKIVDIARNFDFNILIRLHPLLTGGKTGWENANIDWKARLEQVGRKYHRVHIALDDDIDKYLLASDICVTDASSVGMEFMLLGKPTVFLPAPNFFKAYGNQRPVAWVREGLEVKNAEELGAKLKSHAEGKSSVNVYPIEKLIYNPGRALETVVSFLEGLTRILP